MDFCCTNAGYSTGIVMLYLCLELTSSRLDQCGVPGVGDYQSGEESA